MYFWCGLFIGAVATLMAGAFGRWLDAGAEIRRLREEQRESDEWDKL